MEAADNATDSTKLHVSTLLIASERALTNALEELGFAEDDDRVIQHEGRLAFLTCSHDPDCDDLFALISELAARGETWELQFRVDTGEGRAVFQRLARHQSVEALDAELPPDTEESDKELPVHDVDTTAVAPPCARRSTGSILPAPSPRYARGPPAAPPPSSCAGTRAARWPWRRAPTRPAYARPFARYCRPSCSPSP